MLRKLIAAAILALLAGAKGLLLTIHQEVNSLKRLAVLAILAVACVRLISCGGSSGPSGPNCQNFAGTYIASFNNSCRGSGSGTVTVSQTGCDFTAVFSGQGTIAGTVSGNSATFTLTFSFPCSGTATGNATVSSTAINGTYSGRAIGAGCCDPVSGSFTLTR